MSDKKTEILNALARAQSETSTERAAAVDIFQRITRALTEWWGLDMWSIATLRPGENPPEPGTAGLSLEHNIRPGETAGSWRMDLAAHIAHLPAPTKGTVPLHIIFELMAVRDGTGWWLEIAHRRFGPHASWDAVGLTDVMDALQGETLATIERLGVTAVRDAAANRPPNLVVGYAPAPASGEAVLQATN